VPPGVPVETPIDVVLGTLWYRVLAIPGPLDDTLADELVSLIARARPGGPGARPRRAR
jgi:hypothetical protein